MLKASFLHKIAEEEPTLSYTDFQGIPITLEWRKGEIRTGTNPEGEVWERKLNADYGFIPGTVAANGDGEDLDVYLGDNPDAPEAYLVEQLDENGEFDEFKTGLGFNSESEFLACYRSHFPPDWDIVGDVWATPVSKLKKLLEDSGVDIKVTKTSRFFTVDEVKEIGRKHLSEHPELRALADAYNKARRGARLPKV
jgi:hypothetical protein